MGLFSSHIGRDEELGAHLCDPTGGQKFEVMPLRLVG